MKSEKVLYYLLVGINEYPKTPLRGCVNDVTSMEKYLDGLSGTNRFSRIESLKLLNGEATKEGVVNGIQNHLGKAKDGDVAFFYYSGHGANEATGGLFKDELDDLLECIVCFPNTENSTQHLLADKELRYLFSNIKNNPHLVTVFDACHSGDMTRGDDDEDSEVSLKRLSNGFPVRDYGNFIFSDVIKKEEIEEKDLSDLMPNKNHVHIGACLSHESSWEKKGKGVFTNYLLQLLEGTSNQICYLDITRYAKMSLRNLTQAKQTPTVNAIGEGDTNHLSPWLNLHDELKKGDGSMVSHHHEDGWIYTYGQLMGIEDGASLTIVKGDQKLQTKVVESNITYSTIQQLEEMKEWNVNEKFRAFTNTLYAPLEIYLNASDEQTIKSLNSIINGIENVTIVGKEQAHFYLNIFNNLVYFSRNGDPYRPIARQYELSNTQVKLEDFLEDQLNSLIKWNHFNTFSNPANPFNFEKDQKILKPIEVTFHLEGENNNEVNRNEPIDVTDGITQIAPLPERHSSKGYFYNRYRITVKNISQDTLYIGVLRLGSDLSIDCYCAGESRRLEPGKVLEMYTTKPDKAIRRISFYDYQEGYNWRFEEVIFKFIVNTSDFTPTFKEMQQPSMDLPYFPECAGEDTHRTAGRRATTIIISPMEWDVYSCSLQLQNPSHNRKEGRLKDCPDKMANDKWFGSFIPKLYNP